MENLFSESGTKEIVYICHKLLTKLDLKKNFAVFLANKILPQLAGKEAAASIWEEFPGYARRHQNVWNSKLEDLAASAPLGRSTQLINVNPKKRVEKNISRARVFMCIG